MPTTMKRNQNDIDFSMVFQVLVALIVLAVGVLVLLYATVWRP